MAFASTIEQQVNCGSVRLHVGLYTNAGGDTGGEVLTGLGTTLFFWLQPFKSAVIANQVVVNETRAAPLASNSITIVTDDGDDGMWAAFGY